MAVVYLLAGHSLATGLNPATTAKGVPTTKADKLGPEPGKVVYTADGRTMTPEEFAASVVTAAEEARERTLRSLLVVSLAALAGAGLLAGVVGWVTAGRALRPIHRITATARRVADRSLHERIALTGPADEVTELADTFDAMLERLDRAFDGQRRFVANASHELRTPLTLNRTLIEVALGSPDAGPELRQLGGTLLAVNARHERLIDGLLTLARSEHEVAARHPVDLAELAAAAADQVPEQAEPPVRVRLRLAPAPTAGDPVLIERLVQNLIGNAARHNVPGGWVAVATGTHDGQAVLVVANTGPPVPGREVPGLFEPFRRLAGDRVGSERGVGLGLSIVRSVAHAHGGSVHAEPRDGGGLVVRLALPGA